MEERKLIGHIIWDANPKRFNDYSVEMATTPEEAQNVAKRILENVRKYDPSENVGNSQDDPGNGTEVSKKYRKYFEKANMLENIRLSRYREIVFQKVYAYVETGPDLSVLDTVTDKMRTIYARHEKTWKAMPIDRQNEFLECFAAQQPERSNYEQYHFCLRCGLSYRHILHEMKQRGMPDKSFIKADYSLLFYLEDYDAWEEWSKRQEASLMRENAHKTCVPADRSHSDCEVRNPSISSVT